MEPNFEDDVNSCIICQMLLIEPFICCAECGPPYVQICLHCFARGCETGSHQSYHQYEVIKNDFVILDKCWTAAEELKLLEAITDFGFGNWVEIARQVGTKSKTECENHYIHHYIDNTKSHLSILPAKDMVLHPAPVVFKLCEDPPRPPEGSTLQSDMAGYQAARGDYFTEYDNFAEMDIVRIPFEEEEDDFQRSLNFAVLGVYRNCLKARQRTKRILRDHGLISQKKLQVCYQHYNRTIGDQFNGLRVFLRLMNPLDSDQLPEAFALEKELQSVVMRLQEYRQNGIKILSAGRVYDRLKRRRREESEKRHCLTNILSHLQDETACQQWLERHAAKEGISKGMPVILPPPPKRSARPLNISELPGYEKLSVAERDLCSLARIVPDSFMEFKRILIAECSKYGCMRLAQARTLLKIDVNKTRKMYDFLLEQGLICKDPV